MTTTGEWDEAREWQPHVLTVDARALSKGIAESTLFMGPQTRGEQSHARTVLNWDATLLAAESALAEVARERDGLREIVAVLVEPEAIEKLASSYRQQAHSSYVDVGVVDSQACRQAENIEYVLCKMRAAFNEPSGTPGEFVAEVPEEVKG